LQLAQSITSEDLNTKNAEKIKLINLINLINTGNIQLMKDLHHLLMQQLNSSKADEPTKDSLNAIDYQEIETLLNLLNIWYEECNTDRIQLKELKKQADAFGFTRLFVPTPYEFQHHLDQIQAQLDLDRKIKKMSHLIDHTVTICKQKSDKMDSKSKTKLIKSKELEVSYIKQEKAASQDQAQLHPHQQEQLFVYKFKRKQPSSSPDKVQAVFRASKFSKVDKLPPKPPSCTAKSQDAKTYSWLTTKTGDLTPRLTQCIHHRQTTASNNLPPRSAKRYTNTFQCLDAQTIYNLQKRIGQSQNSNK
jgi:hypothetical protein